MTAITNNQGIPLGYIGAGMAHPNSPVSQICREQQKDPIFLFLKMISTIDAAFHL